MTHKSGKVSTLIAGLHSDKYDPHYLGYFECFNRQLFYEAHDVLEELWIASKNTPEAKYYQGLIMATGAFVHFQRNRPKGASNLLKMAIERLKPFGAVHQGFQVGKFVEILESWLYLVDSMGYKENPFHPNLAPKLPVTRRMKLPVALVLILVELGAGTLLTIASIPIAEVRRSFFTFQSSLVAILFLVAAGVQAATLSVSGATYGLLVAVLFCIASLVTSHRGRWDATRWLHWAAGSIALLFGMFCTISAVATQRGVPPPFHLERGSMNNFFLLSSVLGALLLGIVHNAMALGHWYLISRNLSFFFLIRAVKLLLWVLIVRALIMGVFLSAFANMAPGYGPEFTHRLFSSSGNLVFFLMRVLWGLVLPFVLAFMAWRCALGKANQAATGLLYLCEVSVLFGELFATYLMV